MLTSSSFHRAAHASVLSLTMDTGMAGGAGFRVDCMGCWRMAYCCMCASDSKHSVRQCSNGTYLGKVNETKHVFICLWYRGSMYTDYENTLHSLIIE